MTGPLVLPLLLSLAVSGDKQVERRRETNAIVQKLAAGEMQPNAAVNRLMALDQEANAVEQMTQLLAKPGTEIKRGSLLQVLALLAKPGQAAELVFLKELQTDDVANVRTAMQGLARMKSKKAVADLTLALGHKLLGIRLEAARTLGAIGDPKCGPALMKAARAEADLEVRAVMLVAVGQVGDSKDQAALEGFLTNSSETSRMAAARGLCLLGAPKGLEFAKKALASEDRLERQQAVLLLEGGPKAVTPLLTKALDDKDLTVRARAARILVQQGDRSKLGWLVIESYKAPADQRGPYETELETLRISDEDRKAILVKAGLE